MDSDKMVVGWCLVDLLIPATGSLKGKRQVLKSIIGKVRHSFNISIAEVGNHDLWQRASLGLSLVGNDRRFVDSALSKVVAFIQISRKVTVIKEEREIINF